MQDSSLRSQINLQQGERCQRRSMTHITPSLLKKETVRNIKKACLAVLDNKGFKLRKHMKRMGIQADKHHRDRDEKNNRKIKHLESLQKDIFGPDINSKAVKPNRNKKRLPNRSGVS